MWNNVSSLDPRSRVRLTGRAACAGGLLLMFFAASGMTGGNCNTTNPGTGPGGNTNTGGTGPTILASDHVLGVANAKVTVVEYLDFQ